MPTLVSALSATPALASTRSRTPLITNGSVSRSRIRPAIRAAVVAGGERDHERELVAAQPDEQVGTR